ncbi:MAG: DUF2066 domain-containing protein [Gammaproteobacteria bacterium]|nr:DUF2066 domain-containing protein [Gammaproteobacteria bacterium]
MNTFATVCWILLGVAMSGAHAATVENLHTASVPVLDGSDLEFANGLGAAFEIVLVKLTGDSASLKQASLRKLVARATHYNTAFGYENAADGSLHLRADFDLPAVSGALRERGLKVWGKDRPTLAASLVVADATGRTLSPSEMNRAIFEAFVATAAQRAVPLRRPVTDTKLANLVANAVTDEEMLEGLVSALVPMGTPVILIGIVRQQDAATWQGRWRLELAEAPSEWTTTGPLPVPLVTEGVNRAVDTISRHFSALATASGDSVVRLTVAGIVTADDYGRVLNYLATLDPVAKLGVRRVFGSQVEFELQTDGGLASVAQVIGFGEVLTPSPDNPTLYQLNSL